MCAKRSFGDHFPGQADPLDGFRRIVDVDSGTFKYFLKLVPTTYISPSGESTAWCPCRQCAVDPAHMSASHCLVLGGI